MPHDQRAGVHHRTLLVVGGGAWELLDQHPVYLDRKLVLIPKGVKDDYVLSKYISIEECHSQVASTYAGSY